MSEQDLHQFRVEIDKNIRQAAALKDQLKAGDQGGRELSLVYTKLQEAKMWVGKVLEAQGAPFPTELRDEAKEPSQPEGYEDAHGKLLNENADA